MVLTINLKSVSATLRKRSIVTGEVNEYASGIYIKIKKL